MAASSSREVRVGYTASSSCPLLAIIFCVPDLYAFCGSAVCFINCLRYYNCFLVPAMVADLPHLINVIMDCKLTHTAQGTEWQESNECLAYGSKGMAPGPSSKNRTRGWAWRHRHHAPGSPLCCLLAAAALSAGRPLPQQAVMLCSSRSMRSRRPGWQTAAPAAGAVPAGLRAGRHMQRPAVHGRFGQVLISWPPCRLAGAIRGSIQAKNNALQPDGRGRVPGTAAARPQMQAGKCGAAHALAFCVAQATFAGCPLPPARPLTSLCSTTYIRCKAGS